MSAVKHLFKPVVVGAAFAIVMLGTQASADQAATPAARKTPVAFVPNVGQIASPVRFLATTSNLDLYLTGDEVVFGFTEHDDTPRDRSAHARGGSARKMHEKDTRGNVRMKLVGGHLGGQPVGFDLQRGKSHYLIGNDPSKWHRNVPNYGGVRIPRVYPGVDLVLHGENGRIQYDFEVAPGADHRAVEVEFAGAEQADLTPEGDLVLKTRRGELRNLRPRIYQDHEDGRRDVVGRFVRRGQHRMGFEIEAHDSSRPLVIDPEVVFYPLFGGNLWEWVGMIAGDAEGNAYVTGATGSFDFPSTGGVLCQPDPPPPPGQDTTCRDAFVTKLDPAGEIVYSTYLGGGNVDVGTQVGVDDSGSAYVVGWTASAEFPAQGGNTLTCYPHCTYLFIAKLDPTGSNFQFVNLFGDWHDPYEEGTDYGWTFPEGMALDSQGSVYVRGLTWTMQFPTTPGVIGPGDQVPRNSKGFVEPQAFVVKFDSAGSVVYATLLPVSEGSDDCYDCIAVDWSGHAYVFLDALSPDLPGGPGVAGPLAVKLNRTATAIEYSTPLPADEIVGIDTGVGVDVDGQLYLALAETHNPPVGPGSYQWAVHVLKLNAHGTAVLYDTALPSALPPCLPGQDVFPSSLPLDLAVEPYGRVFLLAYTYDAGGCNTAIGTWMRELSHTGEPEDVLFGDWAPRHLALGADGNLYLGTTEWGSQPDPHGQPQVDIAVGMIPNTIEPDPDPSCRGCGIGEPVSAVTGNVFLDQTDIAIPGLRGALVFKRSYNSTNTRDGAFGLGWSHPYEKSLTLRNSKLLMLRDADGVVNYYAGDGGGHFEPSTPINKESWIDAQADGTFVRSLRDGGSERYDDNGRLAAIVDPLGNTTTLEPDADGMLWKIKDPSLRELTLTYTDGHVTDLSGPAGTIAAYLYANGKLQSVTYADSGDPAKRSGFTFGYEGDWLGTVQDFEGRTLETHTYYPDGKGFSSAVSGAIEGYTFVYEPNLTTVTDAVGTVVKYEWSEFGGMKRVTRITRPCSRETGEGGCTEAETWDYDGEGRATTHTDAAGITTRYTYYANGDLHTQTDADGTGLARTTTYSYEYDAGTGRITKRTRTAPGQGTLVEDYGLAGPTSIRQSVQSGQDRVVGFTYTPQGLLETATDPRNSNWVTTYHYSADGTGNLEWVEDPKGHRTRFGYDPLMGWRTKVTDALGSSLDDPEHTTTTEYDPLGRVKVIHLPLNAAPNPNPAQTEFTYDRGGLKATAKDALGRVTQYLYDPQARLERVVDPAKGTTWRSYDVMSRLVTVTDALGRPSWFVPDLNGRLKYTQAPDGSQEILTYDDFGRLRKRQDRNLVTTTYWYDEAGRLWKKTYSDNSPDVVYGFDSAWRVNSVGNGTDTVTRTYDLAGQLRTETSLRNGTTLTYGYDLAGNRSDLALGSSFLTYGYDEDSRLSTISRGAAGFVFGYDAAHHQRTLDYPNQVSTSYTPDNRSQLSLIETKLGTTVLASFGYLYDAVGNRTQKQAMDYLEKYDYDALGQLKKAERSGGLTGIWRYGYDKVGNRNSTQSPTDVSQSSYDVRNQLFTTQAGGPVTWRGTLSEPATVSLTSATVNGQPAQILPGNVFESTVTLPAGNNQQVAVAAKDTNNNVRTYTYRIDVAGTSQGYGYDPKGNLCAVGPGANCSQGTTLYEWTVDNQLKRVTTGGAEVARFSYDGLGRGNVPLAVENGR